MMAATWPGRALLALAAILSTLALPSLADDIRRSGFTYMSPSTQALQRDDAQNPVMLWVSEGKKRWHETPPGVTGATSSTSAAPSARSCAGCHGEIERSMSGVAARYPAWDARSGEPVNLQRRINLCRERHQSLAPLASEDDTMLALEAAIALQSRGQPLARPDDPRLAESLQRGADLFSRRIGQLALSCAQCHDQHAGGRLGGSTIPQGHPTAYPIYRLQWQSPGSLARRLRGCLTGVRAELLAPMSRPMIELELFLAARAAGMTHEGPGVRP